MYDAGTRHEVVLRFPIIVGATSSRPLGMGGSKSSPIQDLLKTMQHASVAGIYPPVEGFVVHPRSREVCTREHMAPSCVVTLHYLFVQAARVVPTWTLS